MAIFIDSKMEVTYIQEGMQDNLNGISIFQGLNGGFQLKDPFQQILAIQEVL